MSVEYSTPIGNPSSNDSPVIAVSPQLVADELQQAARDLQAMIPRAVEQAESFDQVERTVRDALREIDGQAMRLFLALQGDGDLGEDSVTSDGATLRRSDRKRNVNIRFIFGLHKFQEFMYSRGKNKAIELRPISARVELPAQRWSFLLQEVSQFFCAEAAFNQAADHLESSWAVSFRSTLWSE